MRRAMPRSGSSNRTREQPIRSSAPTLSVERTETLRRLRPVFQRTACRNRHDRARRRYGPSDRDQAGAQQARASATMRIAIASAFAVLPAAMAFFGCGQRQAS
jgi:hypothetical protein